MLRENRTNSLPRLLNHSFEWQLLICYCPLWGLFSLTFPHRHVLITCNGKEMSGKNKQTKQAGGSTPAVDIKYTSCATQLQVFIGKTYILVLCVIPSRQVANVSLSSVEDSGSVL